MIFSYGGGPESIFSFALVAIIGIVLVASWVILAASRFVQGGVVERPERVPQLYGYTMCLIGLLVAISSLVSAIEHTMVLADPVHAPAEWETWTEPSVTSFEAFRATWERAARMTSSTNDPSPPSPSEDELRRRYEGLRADRIDRNRVSALRGLTLSLVLLAIAIGLFVYHWRWLRRLAETRATPADVPGHAPESSTVSR